jgi:hypothetical protein
MPETAADWILPGFLARGNMTLLTSMWKAGKTTLLAHLLARRANNQPLLGRPVAHGKTVVISEEPRTLWADRCRHFNFGGQLCLYPQPFPNLPTAEQWRSLLQRVTQLQADHGIDLLVIDSLTHFLRAENAASGVLDLLMPVRALTARGVAALLMHHPRRCGASAGNAGRGHGAIHTEVDISIEMRHAGANLDSRARRFFCLSRHADTPRHLLFELNADASDYTVLPEADDDSFSDHWDVLRMVMEDAPQKLTRLDILDEWPSDFPKPCLNQLKKWLNTAIAASLINVEGTGRKADPFRYWVPAAADRWNADPLHAYLEKQARDLKLPFVPLREQKRRQAGEPINESSSRIWPPGSPID